MSKNAQLTEVLNSIKSSDPTFSTELLSNKDKKIEFRSMHVKDQKVLLMETENENEIAKLRALAKILKNCLITELNVENLYLQDFIWLLLNLQMKSAGESIELESTCKYCQNKGPVLIVKLDDEKTVTKRYLGEIKHDTVEVNKDLIIHLTLPRLSSILSLKSVDISEVDAISSNIDYVEFKSQIVEFSDEDKLELLGSLTPKILSGFKKFVEENDFGVDIKTSFKCLNSECGKENSVDISDNIYNFF